MRRPARGRYGNFGGSRNESRDLELRSPIWGGYCLYARVQAIGHDFSRLHFDRLTREQDARLGPVLEHLRREWRRLQNIRGVGGTGRTIHQMRGSALHHLLVDGDCFVLPRNANGLRMWDLYPGDALAEHRYSIGSRGQSAEQLGVRTDRYGRPQTFMFGNGLDLSRLNWGYSSYGSSGINIVEVPAARVLHIRNLSSEITAVRGWPFCTRVIEDIARIGRLLFGFRAQRYHPGVICGISCTVAGPRLAGGDGRPGRRHGRDGGRHAG